MIASVLERIELILVVQKTEETWAVKVGVQAGERWTRWYRPKVGQMTVNVERQTGDTAIEPVELTKVIGRVATEATAKVKHG